MDGHERREQRKLERALRFQTCPDCSIDLRTGEGERSCHYYACPYLPDVLDVTCPACAYNFATADGTASCGDPPSCEYARDEAPAHVAALDEWLRRHTVPVP